MFNKKKRIFKITYIVDISAAGLLQNYEVKTVRATTVQLYPNCFHFILKKACGRNISNICYFEDSFFG